MLFLPGIAPQEGGRGISCGNVFFPLSGEIPSPNQWGICVPVEKPSPPENGLVFHYSGRLCTAETGQSATMETGEIQYGQTINGIPCVSFEQGSSLLFPDIGLTGSFDTTISAWVFFPSSPQKTWVIIAGWGRRLESQPPTGKSSNNDIGFMNGEKSSLLNLRYKAGWSCGSQTLLDTIQTKTWYHMVMTVEKETKTAKAFLNGSFVGSKNFDEFDIESSSFYINYELEHSYSNPCSVAGIRVYNRILSENELNVLNAEFSEKKIFIPLRENPGAEPQPGQTGVLLNCGGQRIFFPVLNDNVSDNGGLA